MLVSMLAVAGARQGHRNPSSAALPLTAASRSTTRLVHAVREISWQFSAVANGTSTELSCRGGGSRRAARLGAARAMSHPDNPCARRTRTQRQMRH
jgi:hypothetical protein